MMEAKDLPMETEICHNCKREIPQTNYVMHVAHCARNMAVCPVCGDAVPKAHLKEHRQQQHTLVECKACRFKVQSGAMEQHKANSCGKRVVPCQYCELELPHCDIPDHENYCGARTERCPDCEELVMLKYQKLHLESNHGFLKLDDEPGPVPSWEAPVSRPQTSRSVLNDFNTLTTNLNNVVVSSPCKADYKAPIFPDEPLRDTPRTLITPYDASEDLRAKVKLARHDLNEIKNSYLSSVHDRPSSGARAAKFELPATNKKTRDKFVTNLVPYEKNKSFQVNALPLDDKPKNYYNYLGAKEEPPSNLLKNGGNTTGATPKKLASNGTVPKQRVLKKKAPAPPVPLKIPAQSTPPPAMAYELPSSLDEVALPCEFCSKMIPAIHLVQHETSCRPDLTQLKPDILIPAATKPPQSPEVQLPCEFCSELYPASGLLRHQASCGV